MPIFSSRKFRELLKRPSHQSRTMSRGEGYIPAARHEGGGDDNSTGATDISDNTRTAAESSLTTPHESNASPLSKMKAQQQQQQPNSQQQMLQTSWDLSAPTTAGALREERATNTESGFPRPLPPLPISSNIGGIPHVEDSNGGENKCKSSTSLPSNGNSNEGVLVPYAASQSQTNSGNTPSPRSEITRIPTLSPKPKDERRARTTASKFLEEQIHSQSGTQRTKHQAKAAVVSKVAWMAAKRIFDEQVSSMPLRTRSHGQQAAHGKPGTTAVEATNNGSSQIPVRSPMRLKDLVSGGKAAGHASIPVEAPTASRTVARLPAPLARSILGPRTPSPKASPSPHDASSPRTPTPSPAASPTISSSSPGRETKELYPGDAKSVKLRRQEVGPCTCTYDTRTMTSLGAPYRPWVRWRCCECRHETHWESKVCSKLDCTHARCGRCEELGV